MEDPRLEALRAHVTARLSPQRAAHSLGVMAALEALAPHYGLAAHQARLAGLLHDIAKDLSPAAQFQLAKDYGLTLNDPCEAHPVYLHGLVGAAYCAHELGVSDGAVLDAIAAHSYNRVPTPQSATLAWCLRIADLLAPVRPWPGMAKLRATAFAGRLEDAQLLLCRWVGEFYTANAIPVHPLLRATEAELLERHRPEPAFFSRA